MDEARNYEGDLQYVRQVVQKAEGIKAPVSIYYLWAVLCLVGWPMVDFAPRSVGLYWMIAGPVGFLLSGYIGWRYSRTLGQVSMRDGIFTALHWLGALVAMGLVSLLVINEILAPSGIPHVILLILAFSYFTAGLYQARPLLWIGVLLAVAYAVAVLIQGPVWTILGVVVAASLVASAHIGGRRA
jgi:hypothetical protein